MSRQGERIRESSASPLDLQEEFRAISPHRYVVEPPPQSRVDDGYAHLFRGVPYGATGHDSGHKDPEGNTQSGDAQDDEPRQNRVLEGETEEDGKDCE